MQKLKYFFLPLCLLLATNTIMAQNKLGKPTTKVIEATVEVTYAQKLGKIPAIKTLIQLEPTDPLKKQASKKKKKVPPNFIGRGNSRVQFPELEHQGPDPIRQSDFSANGKAVPEQLETLVNMNGQFSGGPPSDPSGDIGLDYYVQAVNSTSIRVYDKEGNTVGTFSGNTLWNEINFNSGGDPIVIFDHIAERWLITEFQGGANFLLVAISDDSDPLGEYTAYNFSTPSFPDYPKYGMWNNAYTATTNEGGNMPIYMIDREGMLNGDETVSIQRVTIPKPSPQFESPGSEQFFLVAAPADWTGSLEPETDPIFLSLTDGSWVGSNQDVVEMYTIDIDFDNSNNTQVTNTSIPVTAYDSYPCTEAPGAQFPCAPQQGGTPLDALPEVVMHQPNYRNFGTHESLVYNFITDVTDGQNVIGIRWGELRKTNEQDWHVYQEGTFAPDDGLHRYFAGISIDVHGNIAMAYNASGPNDYAGIRITGRKSSDPLGVMTFEETIVKAGESTINSNGRFADYSHMSIDPVNEQVFWYTTEYANSSGSSNTRIVAFEIGRDTIDIGPESVDFPVTGVDKDDSEIVAFRVTNFGLADQTEFSVGYIVDDNPPVIEEVTASLAVGGNYVHLFDEKVDMSAFKEYDFKFFTSLEGDFATVNDTLLATIAHLARWDVGVTNIEILSNGVCQESVDAVFELTNLGEETLTSASIDISLNGIVVETIEWTGSLVLDESTEIDISVSGFNDGDNTLSVTASNPNENIDQSPENNGIGEIFEAFVTNSIVVLELLTDNFADETTWTVSNEEGNTILSGGPYNQNATLFEEELCLGPNACYTFTLNDSGNDGICCGQFGNGNYTLINADGTEIATGGQFNSSVSHDFCAAESGGTVNCLLSAAFSASWTSANEDDGVLLVVPQNGLQPFQYSLDNGASFQNDNIFDGLAAGAYTVLVKDANDCEYSETISIESCTLEAVITVNNTNGGADGSISIDATNGTGNITYSINGGATFVNSNQFTALPSNNYSVIVQDESGQCSIAQDVSLNIVGIESTTYGQMIEVLPNPTDGVFRINVKGLDQENVFLPIAIHDVDGRLVYESNLVRYDDTFTGMLSLYAYPSGVYFVRFLNEDVERMVRVVKK